MTPTPGQIWTRGPEVRTITRIDGGYIHAKVAGSYQRDRVICPAHQWAKWAARATCTRFDECERAANA